MIKMDRKKKKQFQTVSNEDFAGVDIRVKRLQNFFDSRKINKTEFEREMRKYSPRFSRQFLNMILKGERNLTDKTWGLLSQCLKWEV